MKESKKNDSSRRHFLKTSGKIAFGATLVSGGAAQVSAQTNQLGPGGIVPHPGALTNYFRGQMKLPGWVADTTPDLFLEEAIHQDKTYGFDAFIPPNAQNPFEDPLPVLGAPFDKDPNSYSAFEQLLADITKCARKYNADLYWVRRLHFHLRHALDPSSFIIHTAPPRNPHGDDDLKKNVADWLPQDFSDPTTKPIQHAQDRWNDAVSKLAAILKQPQIVSPVPPQTFQPVTFRQIWADMIQVNGYIVSIRLVADDQVYRGETVREIGGSSSSHISISSAFSSK